MADPVVDDLIARVAALEEAGPYPGLAVLQRKLEQNWNPDADSVLAPGSITIGLLDGAMKFGKTTATYPGGSEVTTNLSVLHGLGRTPTIVLCQSSSTGSHARPSSIGVSSFNVNARTIDGVMPAAATPVDIWWLAL